MPDIPDEYDRLLKVVDRPLKDGFYVRCELSPVKTFPNLSLIRIKQCAGAGPEQTITVNSVDVVEYDNDVWCRLCYIGNDCRMITPNISIQVMGVTESGREPRPMRVGVENLMKVQ